MAKIGRMVKESMVKELSTALAEQPNFIVTSVNRLAPADADALRQKLYSAQASLHVFKVTLGRLVLSELKMSELAQLGENGGAALGFVVSPDVLPVAKHLVDFIKDHEKQLTIEAAVFEGQILKKKQVEELANLPPKPVLLAQVLGTIEAPIADVIFTVERLIGDCIWIADQIATKKPQASGSPTPQEGTTP